MCFVNTLEYLRHLKTDERRALIRPDKKKESKRNEKETEASRNVVCIGRKAAGGATAVDPEVAASAAAAAMSNQKMTFRRALPQILATTAKNLILLGYGMTLGFPTIVIPNVMADDKDFKNLIPENAPEPVSKELKLTLDQISWFSSINLLCVPIGCLLSGALTQPFGRKKSMLALNFPFIVAWILYRYAHSVGVLYAALAITGLTGGLLEAPVLTYVAEITDPELRGILSATSSTCVILGVFITFLMGTVVHWRDVALINIVFPIAAIVALLFVPESPHWLIGQERFDDAKKSLQWLRGWVQPGEVEDELNHLKKVIDCQKGGANFTPNFPLYCKKNFLHPFSLVVFVFAVGHLGGMTTLQTFAVSIFAEVGSPLDKYVSTVILGLSQLIGAMVCVGLIKFVGKKPLAVASSVCCGLLMLAVALNTKVRESRSVDNSSWLPLTGLVGSAFASHICLRLLPWILIGEVFPPEVRATASGLSGGAGYILGFVANKSYLYLVKSFHVWGTLLAQGLVSVVGGIILVFFLPETEGLTLHQIQDHFEKGSKRDKGDKTDKGAKENWARDNPAQCFDDESHL